MEALTPMDFINVMKKKCKEVTIQYANSSLLSLEEGRKLAYEEMGVLIDCFLEQQND